MLRIYAGSQQRAVCFPHTNQGSRESAHTQPAHKLAAHLEQGLGGRETARCELIIAECSHWAAGADNAH